MDLFSVGKCRNQAHLFNKTPADINTEAVFVAGVASLADLARKVKAACPECSLPKSGGSVEE